MSMIRSLTLVTATVSGLGWLAAADAAAQTLPFERLPVEVLDARSPSEWVRGIPGRMIAAPLECRSVGSGDVRRRIVDIAVQEWGFFGFPVQDRINETRLLPPGAARDPDRLAFEAATRRAPLLNGPEAARVASTIGGYWAATPDGRWILEEQNDVWNGFRGIGARWRSPWSAAFISWVMCEAGLGERSEFRRSIAHRDYIDQAIRARDGQAPTAAYAAYDIGEAEVVPGDLLCDSRRPVYRNVAERRRQMGTGAGTHCDIVVAVYPEDGRILAIGGNVLRAVSLKVFPAGWNGAGRFQPMVESGRTLFAHLKLQADPVENDALTRSPAFAAYSCVDQAHVAVRLDFVTSSLGVQALPDGMC